MYYLKQLKQFVRIACCMPGIPEDSDHPSVHFFKLRRLRSCLVVPRILILFFTVKAGSLCLAKRKNTLPWRV